MLDTILTLDKANSSIVSNNGKVEQVSLVNELTLCQETAFLLGTYLETLGKTESLVYILEDYCENIYQMSISLSDDIKFRQLSKKINEQLIKLYNEIKYDLPEDKKEIVFLPYKASMWDSLESVWKATIEDQNCDVYVVPIPYFSKNPDKTLGQMYYEGDEFPDYVPITSWKDYKFEERRPDVTYIHNPYDKCNFVTTIHPSFYAKEIKKYTGILVYIPYFVAINDNVEPHLCVLPGTLHSDKVIVESENVRRIYIEELQKFEKENNCKDVFGNVEEKVIALGSPKYDKVLMNQEDLNIPKDWLEMMYKQDGSIKKVVLYNTTVTAMLQNTEMMIRKIQSVINYFEQEKELLLLWRPHPLLKATLKSMRGSSYPKYMQIESDFKAKKFGIYDESSNLQRAINLSDIYYGDYSSVADLFRSTGKPVLFQNLKVDGFDIESQFVFLIGMSVYKNNLYAMLYDRNVVIKIDLLTKTMHYYGKLPNKPMLTLTMYNFTKIYGDKLYYVPFSETKLLVYDFNKQEYDEIDLELKQELSGGEGNFYNCHIYKNRIFLFPFRYRAILCLDLKTRQIVKSIDLSKEFPLSDNPILFIRYALVDETHVLLPVLSSNKILMFDLERFIFEVFSIGEESLCFNSIVKYKEEFWLEVRNKFLFVKWNFHTKNIQIIEGLSNNRFENYISCFNGKATTLYNNWLYCFPAGYDTAIKVNLDTGEQQVIEELEPYCKSDKINKKYAIFDGFARDGNKLYFNYQVDDSILMYDLDNGEVSVFARKFSNSEEEERRMRNDFIDGIFKDSELAQETRKEAQKVGPVIAKYITNLIN
jgi:hypothetical protein